jgi:hypothetical protein
MARTRRRYSRSKPKRRKRRSTKLKRTKNITKRKRRRSRRTRSRKNSRLAGDYSSDSNQSVLSTWSKGPNEFSLESWGTGEGNSGPLLGRNPSGTRRNIEDYENQIRIEEEGIRLKEKERIARVKSQEQAKRAMMMKEKLGDFNELMTGTSLKDLRFKKKTIKEKKIQEKKDEEEAEYLRKILRGNVRNEDNLVLMDLPDLQALYNEWDRINNVGDGEEMPIAVLNFNK